MSKNLEAFKADLKKDVGEYLGDAAAEREYRAEARKRLYTAISPLRYQLSIACSELANRVGHIADGTQPYPTGLDTYFGRSTSYRLLRIFALTELVERQIAYTDFSVDPFMSALLRFKRLIYACMSGDKIICGHPNANWEDQIEHLYHGSLNMISSVMIVAESDGAQRVRRFDEFIDGMCGLPAFDAIKPLPALLADLTAKAKPILWIRLIALGELCTQFLELYSSDLGIEVDKFDGAALIGRMRDVFVQKNIDRYAAALLDLKDVQRGKNPPRTQQVGLFGQSKQ